MLYSSHEALWRYRCFHVQLHDKSAVSRPHPLSSCLRFHGLPILCYSVCLTSFSWC